MHILDAYSGNVSAVDALKPTASCGILLWRQYLVVIIYWQTI
jgi:hypothetical protein